MVVPYEPARAAPAAERNPRITIADTRRFVRMAAPPPAQDSPLRRRAASIGGNRPLYLSSIQSPRAEGKSRRLWGAPSNAGGGARHICGGLGAARRVQSSVDIPNQQR